RIFLLQGEAVEELCPRGPPISRQAYGLRLLVVLGQFAETLDDRGPPVQDFLGRLVVDVARWRRRVREGEQDAVDEGVIPGVEVGQDGGLDTAEDGQVGASGGDRPVPQILTVDDDVTGGPQFQVYLLVPALASSLVLVHRPDERAQFVPKEEQAQRVLGQ